MATTPQSRQLPDLEPELTRLSLSAHRSRAFYELVADELVHRNGQVIWLDARNHASTRILYDHVPHECALDGLRIARAFTAYQHTTLARDLPEQATSRTSLIVAPAVADLYRDPDVPEYEASRLLETSLTTLAATADAVDVPTLVTTAREDDATARVDDHADRTIEATETPMGVAYDGPDVQTDVYWQDGWWQTTIAYWADLLGTVDDPRRVTATYGELAAAGGET